MPIVQVLLAWRGLITSKWGNTASTGVSSRAAMTAVLLDLILRIKVWFKVIE